MVPRSTCRCVEFLVFLCLLTIPTLAAALPRVPVIDISSWTGGSGHGDDQLESPSARQQVVSEMREACRNVGFFQITNHGVNSEILETTWRTAREFFEQPREVKLVHKTTDEAEYPYGFEETEQLSKGKELDGDSAQDGTDAGTGVVDTKETFAIGPDNAASGMPTRRWRGTPAVPEFRPSLESYYSEMEKLADVLLEIFALALGQTSDYFVDKTDHHMSALRLVHYYPLMSTNQTQGHVVRAGAHTDYGALTILNSQRAGLEVLVKGDSAAQAQRQWYPVPVVPGALIVNLGDLMQRWTNGAYSMRGIATFEEIKSTHMSYCHT